MKYTVTAKPNSNAFVGLRAFEHTVEFIGYDEEENELYEIESNYDLDRILDTSDGVIHYFVIDVEDRDES